MTTIKGSTKINNLIVDGNLNISGETNINSTSVKIKDNIITLNSKESSNKVSKGTAGIEIYRGSSTKELKAYASTTKDIEEGSKQFSRILLARILTNEANPIETEYYRINTGYNDYTFYHKITIKQTPN